MGDRVKVLIVDDSVLYRKVIRDVLDVLPDIEVVGVARNGAEALEKVQSLKPDLMTLDVEMPVMDGLTVLQKVKDAGLPVKAIMVSAVTERGARSTMQALHNGAFDFVVKPQGSSSPQENGERLKTELQQRILAFKQSHQLRRPERSQIFGRTVTTSLGEATNPTFKTSEYTAPATGFVSGNRGRGCYAAVVIGVSTGGPDALRQFLPSLPGDFPLPVMVVQHMPPLFTKSLAESLNRHCALQVTEAVEGDEVKAGRILIAPGGCHMKVAQERGRRVIRLSDGPPENNCRPAVDCLFRSAVDVYGGNLLGIIMTGMGNDGAAGCRLIKRAGGAIIAQHADSCVVYGMPRYPVEEGLADSVVPLDKLAEEVQLLAGAGALT